MPLTSVLIPCHNATLWLRDAVESICRQSHRNLEILIYDDGSNDGSTLMIEQLANEDHRIVAMGEAKNRGIVHALNAMLGAANGRYIARMDADDISLPQRIEQQIKFIESEKIDLCGTWFQEFGRGIPRNVRWFSGTEELHAALLFQNTICHPTILARREVFDEFQYREDYNLAEDYDFFIRADVKFRLKNLPEVLLRYRRHPQQATRARRAKMEEVTCRIRHEALCARGFKPSPEEVHIHNLIRAPSSISSIEDLKKIEQWLAKLLIHFESPDARRVIASQWTRAAIRAAPLGREMWNAYRTSPLYGLLDRRATGDIDLAILAAIRLDYASPTFEALRRFGLSA